MSEIVFWFQDKNNFKSFEPGGRIRHEKGWSNVPEGEEGKWGQEHMWRDTSWHIALRMKRQKIF